MKLALLAGESSGDNLGTGLMEAIRRLAADRGEEPEFIGVGGPGMVSAGLSPLADMDELNVNGFRDPLLKLPSLFKLLRRLSSEIAAADVDAFVGIDFNVFNFLLEGALVKRGIKTAHYVSPSVYAWRRGRTPSRGSSSIALTGVPFSS